MRNGEGATTFRRCRLHLVARRARNPARRSAFSCDAVGRELLARAAQREEVARRRRRAAADQARAISSRMSIRARRTARHRRRSRRILGRRCPRSPMWRVSFAADGESDSRSRRFARRAPRSRASARRAAPRPCAARQVLRTRGPGDGSGQALICRRCRLHALGEAATAIAHLLMKSPFTVADHAALACTSAGRVGIIGHDDNRQPSGRHRVRQPRRSRWRTRSCIPRCAAGIGAEPVLAACSPLASPSSRADRQRGGHGVESNAAGRCGGIPRGLIIRHADRAYGAHRR